MIDMKKCDICGGKGKLQGYDDLGKCWFCDGTGNVKETWEEHKKRKSNDEINDSSQKDLKKN